MNSDADLKNRIRGFIDGSPQHEPLGEAHLPRPHRGRGLALGIGVGAVVVALGLVGSMALPGTIVSSSVGHGGGDANAVPESVLSVEVSPTDVPVGFWAADPGTSFAVIHSGASGAELLALDVATGVPEGRFVIGANVDVSSTGDDLIFVGEGDTIRALEYETLDERYAVSLPSRMTWTFPTGIPLIEPALGGGRLFVNTLETTDPDVLPWGSQGLVILSDAGDVVGRADLNGCGSPILEATGRSSVAVACMDANAVWLVAFEGGQTSVRKVPFIVPVRQGEARGVFRDDIEMNYPAGIHLDSSSDRLLLVSRNGYLVELDLGSLAVSDPVRLPMAQDEWIPEGLTVFSPDDGRLFVGVGRVDDVSGQTGVRAAYELRIMDQMGREVGSVAGIGPFHSMAEVPAGGVVAADRESGRLTYVTDRGTGYSIRAVTIVDRPSGSQILVVGNKRAGR